MSGTRRKIRLNEREAVIRSARDDDVLPAFRRRCLFVRAALNQNIFGRPNFAPAQQGTPIPG